MSQQCNKVLIEVFIMVLIHNQYTYVNQVYVVYVEGTLYPSISLLENWEGNCECKNSPTIKL